MINKKNIKIIIAVVILSILLIVGGVVTMCNLPFTLDGTMDTKTTLLCGISIITTAFGFFFTLCYSNAFCRYGGLGDKNVK